MEGVLSGLRESSWEVGYKCVCEGEGLRKEASRWLGGAPHRWQPPLDAQIESLMKMNGILLVRVRGNNQASYLCPGSLPLARSRETLGSEIAALPHG